LILVWGLALAGTHDDAILALLRDVHHADDAQLQAAATILAGSDRVGFGLEPVSVHAIDREECPVARAGFEAPTNTVCGKPYMTPLYDPATQSPADATACIDQYEFPDVRASEAAALCEAIGKRLCDAHEWEGACAGALGPADYPYERASADVAASQRSFRQWHNTKYESTWVDGPERPPGTCATGSFKQPDCDGSDWRKCGSNTYPSGSFPDCRSEGLPVYDLWGNAAEHMNLPLNDAQRSRPGSPLGVTEMKGSWFVWDTVNAHEDGCRWRAPYWHGGAVRAKDSHRNYHLGFRCCSDLSPAPP
jgi:hypothetical protein